MPPRVKTITWEPLPGPQYAFFACPAFELLYGGAAGGGKSLALVVQALANCVKYPGYKAIIFRRTFPEIQKSLVPVVTEFMYGNAKSKNQGMEWHFQNGSVCYLSHLQREDDKEKHKSAEYDYVGFDELTSFSESQYNYLFSRCRGTSNVPRMIRSASNPSGPGHSWVRARFVDLPQDASGAPKGLLREGPEETFDFAYGWRANGKVYTDFSSLPESYSQGDPVFSQRSYTVWKDLASGITRAYIPALLWGNAKLLKADPEYVNRLRNLDEKQQQALLYGNWDIYEGQFFSSWDPSIHVVAPFEIPSDWRRYVGIDYGYAAPACALWAAVDPEGNVYVYREMYAQKLTSSEQAERILDLTRDEKIEWHAADPSMFSKSGTGESHSQVYHRLGIPILPSSNKRVAGWAIMHEYLGNGRLKIFRNCANLIRTIPTLTHAKNPDDLDSTQEDHAVDALRYLLITLYGTFSPQHRSNDGDVPDWFLSRVRPKKKMYAEVRL
mgnify:CR=1 FL=1